MLTAAEIAAMRTTVESAMADVCEITRRTATVDDATLNAATGVLSAPAASVLWSGPCRIRSRAAAARDTVVGDVHTVLGQYIATVPVDADGFAVDDYLVVTASGASVELIGVPLQIVDIQIGTWDLGRRLSLQTAQP